MSDSNVYLLINAIPNPEKMAATQQYLQSIMPVFKQYGGAPVGRFKTIEQLVGKGGIKMDAILQFPDTKAIRELVDSEAFKALGTLRSEAFNQLDMMICESM
ncbi:MAG: hypothetical protein AUJ56_11210 [Zetaproteobacteria bacterium CG1_02_49_23]|nr:MAG: hypothetical protein AUJ56_11210 [Zetaproteobacteria bacterium CG1_02_49_23]